MVEYVIQRGDNFFRLAQRLGGTCEEWMFANPGINPLTLQIGQKVVLPEIKNSNAREHYAEIGVDQGNQFAGDKMDDVEMEIEGVHFRIKRIGESRVPHEIHLLVPRTEIRKIQPQGEQGPCEVQIMLSNVDIVHSPRLKNEASSSGQSSSVSVTSTQDSAAPQKGTSAQPSQYGKQSQSIQNPLERTQELGLDIRQKRPFLFRRK